MSVLWMAWLIDQHLEGGYPGCNVIMVTVTDDESRRIEQQSDHETAAEMKAVLAAMFQTQIPDVFNIFVPRWGKDRLFRGAFSNWPIGVDTKTFERIQVSPPPSLSYITHAIQYCWQVPRLVQRFLVETSIGSHFL